jgi:hypothetical protein
MSTSTATPTEEAVARIWRDILQVPELGVEDNFFDLGGHSLLLHMVQERIVADLGRDVPLVELFGLPTVRATAAHLDGADPGGVAPRRPHRRPGARGARRERGGRRG